MESFQYLNQEKILRNKGINESMNSNVNNNLINNNNNNLNLINNNLQKFQNPNSQNINSQNINSQNPNSQNINSQKSNVPNPLLDNITSNNNIVLVNKIKNKVIKYFNDKYPTTFPTIGISDDNLQSIISNILQKNNNKNNDNLKIKVNNLISIFERKIKEKIYSENRQNNTVNTNKFTLDPNVDISYKDYVNSNFNPYNDLENNGNNPNNQNNRNNQNNQNNKNNNKNNSINTNKDDKNNMDRNLNKYDETNNYEEIYKNNIKKLVNQKVLDSGESIEFNEYHLQKANIENKLNKKDIDLLYTEERFFDYNIVLDSKDRDTTKYTNPAEFEIDFGGNTSDGGNSCKIDTVYGNIESIELLHVIIRNHTNILSLPYLLLELKELGSNFNGTNNDLKSTFAILSKYETIGTIDGDNNNPGFNHYEKISNNADTQVKKIFNPRINLSKLTIRLKNPSGEIITFDDDTNDLTSTVVSIGLRITTVQKNMGTNFINKALS